MIVGIASADKNELEAIDQIFQTNRPLNIGSLKSNIGHTEAASGLCAVIKVLVSFSKDV